MGYLISQNRISKVSLGLYLTVVFFPSFFLWRMLYTAMRQETLAGNKALFSEHALWDTAHWSPSFHFYSKMEVHILIHAITNGFIVYTHIIYVEDDFIRSLEPCHENENEALM